MPLSIKFFLPRSLGFGGSAARRSSGLGSHGLADIVNLRLPLGETVHEALVLHDELADDLQVVRKRLLLQGDQSLLLAYQPLHELVKQRQQLLQLPLVLLELLQPLQRPGGHLVPPGLDDGDPVLDDLHSVRVTLLEDLLSKVDGVVLVLLFFLQLLHELFVLGNLPGNLFKTKCPILESDAMYSIVGTYQNLWGKKRKKKRKPTQEILFTVVVVNQVVL